MYLLWISLDLHVSPLDLPGSPCISFGSPCISLGSPCISQYFPRISPFLLFITYECFCIFLGFPIFPHIPLDLPFLLLHIYPSLSYFPSRTRVDLSMHLGASDGDHPDPRPGLRAGLPDGGPRPSDQQEQEQASGQSRLGVVAQSRLQRPEDQRTPSEDEAAHAFYRRRSRPAEDTHQDAFRRTRAVVGPVLDASKHCRRASFRILFFCDKNMNFWMLSRIRCVLHFAKFLLFTCCRVRSPSATRYFRVRLSYEVAQSIYNVLRIFR
jgi:hypothetical protein